MNITKQIRKIFRIRRNRPVIINMAHHNTWGNSVNWWCGRKGTSIHGHLSFRVKPGYIMRDGSKRYRVTEVKQMARPAGQFFADVEIIKRKTVKR